MFAEEALRSYIFRVQYVHQRYRILRQACSEDDHLVVLAYLDDELTAIWSDLNVDIAGASLDIDGQDYVSFICWCERGVNECFIDVKKERLTTTHMLCLWFQQRAHLLLSKLLVGHVQVKPRCLAISTTPLGRSNVVLRPGSALSRILFLSDIVAFFNLSHEAHSIEISSHTYIHTRENSVIQRAVRYTYCALFITESYDFTWPKNHVLPSLGCVALQDRAAITVILRFDADHPDYFEKLRDDGFSEFPFDCLHD